MNKILLIGGDSRSGGSLLARLFDFPNKYLSFPIEHEFFSNRIENFYPLSEYLQQNNLDAVMNTEYVLKLTKLAEGKLTSKQFYDENTINLDPIVLKNRIRKSIENLKPNANNETIYFTIAKVFFKAFLEKFDPKFELITNHCARTFIADLDDYFKAFEQGFFIHTLRSPFDYASSLKHYSYVAKGETKKNISPEFMQMIIERWIIGLWYANNNKFKYGNKYIVMNYEQLVEEPKKMLTKICNYIDIPFHSELNRPTLAGVDWGGNSSFGKLPAKITRSNNTGALKLEEYEELNEKLSPFINHLNIFDDEILSNDAFSNLDTILRQFFGKDFNHKISRKNFQDLHEKMVKVMLA